MSKVEKTELQIQRDICVHMWNNFPETRYCLYHIKNELDNKVSLAEIIKMKQQMAAGFIPGVQDLHFLFDTLTYRLELKSATGTVRPEQKVVHAAHDLQGCKTYIFDTSEQAIEFLTFIVNNSQYNPDFIKCLDQLFSQYISPYSDYTKLSQYESELEKARAKRSAQRKKACFPK